MSEQYRRKRKKQNKAKPLIIIAIIVLVAIAAVGITLAATGGTKKTVTVDKNTQTRAADDSGDDFGNRLSYKGKNYRKKENVKTILFLGIDQESDVQYDVYINQTKGVISNIGRSDTILLFMADEEKQETKVLSISRETMTDVDVYDSTDEFLYSGKMPVTLQYTFGNTPARSLFLSKRTITKLLYNIRIDGAVSLTLDGIRDIVDRLGGIELTMPQDYSYIDARCTEGATVLLNGAEMEHFIRYRDTSVTGSNNERMERTSWLISAVFKELKAKGAMTFLQQIIDSHPEYITSDCDAELLKKISTYPISDEKYNVPGQVTEGLMNDEFYVDEEALQDLIIELLYDPIEEETASEAA